MIETTDTLAALRPWLGSAFLAERAQLIERITTRLNAFTLPRDAVSDIAQWLDNLLFLQVRDDTRGKMVLAMDNGVHYRVRVEDFKDMADDLLYLLFSRFPRNAEAFAAVREYSVKAGSLSALKALYLDFTDFQTVQEWETVRRVISSCHPPYRWRLWIDGKRG